MATTPVTVFAKWKVKAGNMPVVLKLLKELHAASVKEEGNLFYQVHQSRTDNNTLILTEGYTDEVSQQAHINSAHFKKLAIDQIIPLLDEREVTLTSPIEV
ncbi:antibiotic biosynthesis monooxygenase [Niastella yeongjuensis]|uniref:Antibiotic biosynthesis monooxygenase n=1 Tax=Niastella yeongjuensis TaxID=354355 RepID=A0A1V9E9Y1_9BACT|nr:putative quinol monooxygenase [Niastella yeongjuensis]OQP42937.1 antibiotic biosynthesis monooxygenase [Niastella yeongjuensis]SEO60190.1 Quinol monooxygenase YgiN [Niastella yeongjuensis]